MNFLYSAVDLKKTDQEYDQCQAHAQHFVGLDLDHNCLERLSASLAGKVLTI